MSIAQFLAQDYFSSATLIILSIFKNLCRNILKDIPVYVIITRSSVCFYLAVFLKLAPAAGIRGLLLIVSAVSYSAFI